MYPKVFGHIEQGIHYTGAADESILQWSESALQGCTAFQQEAELQDVSKIE